MAYDNHTAPMRLLMTTASKPLYLAYHYHKALSAQADLKVLGFDHNDQFNHFYNKNLLRKVIHKAYPAHIFSQISANLEQAVAEFCPEVVWLFKGMEIQPKTLEKIKQSGCRLVNYNLDHPFEFASRGSGNKNVLDALELYDLHISYSQHIIKQLNAKFPGLATAYLPFGYALEDRVYEQIKKEPEVELACFIGEPDANRAQVIQTLVDHNIEMHVYGRNWEKHLVPSQKLQLHPPVLGKNYWQTLRKYRVQLNIFRPHNKHAHNMRSFEIPAVGGVMLAPRSEEHLTTFTEGKEAFYYASMDEAIEQLLKILAFTPTECQGIRQQARDRSVQSGYSYTDRAQQAYQLLSHIE